MIERPRSRQPIPPHAKRVFEGVIFDVYQWEQELYDGTTTTFEKIAREDTVVIIPSLPDRTLLFLEDEQPSRSTILTFPAGRMDKVGEDPLSCAKREFLEETGYVSDEWELWRSFQPYAKIDWVIYLFVARNCTKVADADPGPGERITVRTVTLDEIIEIAKDPRFVAEETRVDFIEAKYDPEARERLETLFFGT